MYSSGFIGSKGFRIDAGGKGGLVRCEGEREKGRTRGMRGSGRKGKGRGENKGMEESNGSVIGREGGC